ncbi:MAG: glycosyl transferase family 28, partial [Flavitalea sp.]
MVKKPKYLSGTKKHLALISPLDWGLGHTTRCIPIIRELQLNDFEIVIACDTTQKLILYSEFPDITFENFPGYGLKYGKNRIATLWLLLTQSKHILTAIKHEKQLLKSLIER